MLTCPFPTPATQSQGASRWRAERKIRPTVWEVTPQSKKSPQKVLLAA